MASTTKSLVIKDFVLGCSSLIEASAGTGKTFTITYLVLRLLLGSGNNVTRFKQGPLDLDQILIVTFTRAAASDLRKRIRETIRQAREAFDEFAEDPQYRSKDEPLNDLLIEMQARGISPKECSQILNKAERGIDTAAICTIHSFCNRALNQIYAFEAGEAFETELTDDVSALQKEACISLWRKCFYTREDRSFILENVPEINLEQLIKSFKNINKVKLTDPKEGFKGFALKGLKFLDRDVSLEENFTNLKTRLKELLLKKQQFLNDFLVTYDKTYFSLCYDINSCSVNAKALQLPKTPALFVKIVPLLDALAQVYDNPTNIPPFVKILLASKENFLITKKDHPQVDNCTVFKDFENALFALRDNLKGLIKSISELGSEFYLLLFIIADYKLEQIYARERVMSNDDVLKRLDFALNCKGKQSVKLAELLRHRYPVAMIDEFQDTDPTQFSIFKKIYLDKNARNAFCYLIGDPKQSIYSFRGSDINSYLTARNLIDELSHGVGLYTLNTNYRSHPNLVEGVNMVFSKALCEENTHPFLTDDISFNPVNYHQNKSFFSFEEDFCAEKEPDAYAAFYVDSILCDKAQTTKGEAVALYARACAFRVKECLISGFIYTKTDNGYQKRRVLPSDIAILVRDKNENAILQQALDALGIGSVFYSDQSSVLGAEGQMSLEAKTLVFLMEAMCDFSNAKKVRRLLGSDLLGLGGDEFCECLSNDRFEAEVKLLFSCSQKWQREGFLSAFLAWFKDPIHDGIKNILSVDKGERRLTNYLHLAEIVQQSHGKISGIRAQLRWFEDLCKDNNDSLNGEDVQIRLDSEYDQVKILTIHKSKGLEFPIVLMPFLWSGSQSKSAVDSDLNGVFYYDKHDRRVCFDLLSAKENIQAHNDEIKQEDRRLLYVALTRACYANFLFVTELNLARAPVITSLRAMLSTDGSPSLFADKLQLPENRKFFKLSQIQKSTYDHVEKYIPPVIEPPRRSLEASVLPPDAICRDFSFSSYSSLVLGLHDKAPSVLEGDNDDKRTEAAPEFDQRQLNAFTFPRGSVPGVFLHSLLEKCDFTLSNDHAYLSAYVREFVHQSANQGIVKNWSDREDAAVSALTLWLYDMVNAPLMKSGDRHFSLSMLKSGAYIPEMAYLLPSVDMDSRRLNELCKESAKTLATGNASFSKIVSGLYLDKRVVNGFVNGFLDLVMRTDFDGREKYYVIDYKSTHLGNSYRDYAQSNVMLSVFDERNRYDVQYLLYTLALHRMLKSRIPDYSYDKDVGGVLYLYLRGLKAPGLLIDPEVSSGVFFTKPDFSVIERFDALFSGRKE